VPDPSPFAHIFDEEDTLGLLATKPTGSSRSSEEAIVAGQFEAINVFVDEHGFLPGASDNGRTPNLQEYALEGNLETFQSNDAYRALLAPYDRHGLLAAANADAQAPTTLEAVLASDDPLLDDPAAAIFDLKHIADVQSSKATPDDIAKRRPSAEFARFEPIFAELKADVASGKRILKRFEREGSIVPGASFILNGIMAYVASADELQRRGKEYDARIRVIFDNGLESNHLLRSFARALYEDDNGRQIIEAAPTVSGPLFGGSGHVSGPLFSGEAERPEFGEVKGTVYIVESLSPDPNIAALKGRLYKIGFTTQPINKRLATAEKDPTFLCSPVQLRATYETNFSPKKLENLLHQFFAHCQLQVEVVLGKTVEPQEWYVVPLALVEEAVQRILDRSILNYRYDAISRKILQR
jgi:hypothetical protein